VLFKYSEGATSPSDVAAALREPLNVISYHTRVLADAGCIELVRMERRRGATKRYYRATLTSEIGDDAWATVPAGLRRALVRLTMDASHREAADALTRGGMDDASAHVSRSFLALDAQGRRELAALLARTLTAAREIEAAARARGGPDEPHELVVLSFRRASRP
jgi:DNA-binding transcriptional ArsR family regulator